MHTHILDDREQKQGCLILRVFIIIFRNEIDPENVSHSQYAHSLIAQLIQELENKSLNYGSNEDLFLVRIRLDEAANMFKVSSCGMTYLVICL